MYSNKKICGKTMKINIAKAKQAEKAEGEREMSGNGNNKNTAGSGKANAQTIKKKEVAKAYEKYAEKFTPKPTYFKNCVIAFIVGGLICTAALYVQNMLTGRGIDEKDAGTFVTMMLVCIAQLLTGFGWFDTIGKVCGAGVIVPITGFANSMVAPAIEYKKEGIVLGVGSKLFSLAGPVLACGISTATVVGIIYWAIDKF